MFICLYVYKYFNNHFLNNKPDSNDIGKILGYPTESTYWYSCKFIIVL